MNHPINPQTAALTLVNQQSGERPHVCFRVANVFVIVVLLVIFFSYSQKTNDNNNNVNLPRSALTFEEDSSKPRLFMTPDPEGIVLDDIQAYRSNLLIKRRHDVTMTQTRPLRLDINRSDVMVLLHIQKTGGTTFENILVQNTDVKPPCQCEHMYGQRIKCFCRNSRGQDWMFNRHAVGWACGVHADLTEMTSCVDEWYRSQPGEDRIRNYHYVTLVRDPVNRFVSEWQHVRRGATWKESRLHCGGRDATLDEVSFCFRHGDWSGVGFEEFMRCPHNMAINRQTRMLANLSLSDCYRTDSNLTRYQRDEIMLQSAKDNLAKYFDYFGILEYSLESQALFERKFQGLKFTKKIVPKRGSLGMSYVMLSEESWLRVVDLNHLDVRLYQFAKDLFFQRLRWAQIPLGRLDHESKYVDEGFTYTTVTM